MKSRFILAILCCFLVAPIVTSQSLTPFTATAQTELSLPELTGPYKVGQATYHFVDESREEIFTEEADDVRELLLTIYYPAEPDNDAEPALFLSDEAVRMVAANIVEPGFLDHFYAHSYIDAPMLDSEEPYPVVLFSPGLLGMPPVYSSRIEELASHGYIVIGIWEPYSNFVTSFPDGRLAIGNNAGQDPASGPKIVGVWVEDTRFVLNQLEELNESDSLLEAHMDLSRIGIFGHSYGGANTIYMLQRDERVIAGLALDHTPFLDLNDEVVEQPLMLILSEGNRNRVDFVGNGYRLELQDSGHNSFGDSPFYHDVLNISSDIGTIDPARGSEVINAYMVAFFDKHLKGEERPLLDGPSSDYEEMSFEVIE